MSVPLRAGPVFAPYEYPSVPLPVLVPAVSHAALLATFHAHPLCVVTPTDPVPAAEPTLAPVGDSDHVHAGVVPDFDARKFATVKAF